MIDIMVDVRIIIHGNSWVTFGLLVQLCAGGGVSCHHDTIAGAHAVRSADLTCLAFNRCPFNIILIITAMANRAL